MYTLIQFLLLLLLLQLLVLLDIQEQMKFKQEDEKSNSSLFLNATPMFLFSTPTLKHKDKILACKENDMPIRVAFLHT